MTGSPLAEMFLIVCQSVKILGFSEDISQGVQRLKVHTVCKLLPIRVLCNRL